MKIRYLFLEFVAGNGREKNPQFPSRCSRAPASGGLEYRFTPHIGIFGEIAYVFPNLSNNNFIQTNFGLRYAF